MRMTTVEKNNALEGTLRALSFANGTGACLSLAREIYHPACTKNGAVTCRSGGC